MNGKGPPGPRAEVVRIPPLTTQDRRRTRRWELADNPSSPRFGQASGLVDLPNALPPADSDKLALKKVRHE
jgi:hypothetical protein